MFGSGLRSRHGAVCLLLVLGAIKAMAGPDSVTSFDNRPGSGSSSSSTASRNQATTGSSTLPGPLASSSSSSNSGLSCNSKNIVSRGNLSVAETWTEAGPLTLDFVPLPKGQCVGWTITAAALAETACGEKSPSNYVLVEFWQLGPNSTISLGSIGGPGSGRTGLPKVPYNGPVVDVKVLAARGTKPSLTWGPEGQDMIKVVPPIRDPTTGLTPVGSFQDDAGVVYNRPVLRLMFPTNSPVTNVGDPADPNSWYITIANMPDQQALPAYAIRASCVNIDAPSKPPDMRIGGANSSSSSSSKEAGMPCPVPSPGGKQCNGHGKCRTDTSDLSPEYSRYCACDAGWGSWGCQLQLLSLPLNTAEPVTATIPPGKWGFWEVNLPAWQGPVQGSSDVAVAARGGGGSSGSNEQLLLMAERMPGLGAGGNPLLFLKPFDNKDHNEPALDGISFDLLNYADLRSFQLQLNRQFINYRLPLREARGAGPGGRGMTRPRRWYVAIYNSNASRLSEPARVKLWVQYRDLTHQAVACPFDCNGRGRCIDPLSPLSAMRGAQGLPRLPDPKTAGLGDPGLNPELTSLMALGPLQDLSPMDAGFMCSCTQGFGGLLCEGRVQNLTIGSGEQKVGPELLEPGSWFYYVVTIDSKFNPNSDNLGIQWIVGQPSSPPNNYSNAYISFDQGPLHRQQQLMGMAGRQQVRRGMTPYSKLVVRSNPPLPLQVPGGQLSPGGTYVVSIFNNNYVVSMPFIYSLAFYVMAENNSYLHPYMSILLGVTAAVILCLAMTLCKRVVVRYGFVPWRWRQRQRQMQAAGAGGQNSLALVLMAQQQPASRGVPPEIYQAFPCRPFAVKEFQKRQHEAIQQQQQEDAAAADAVDVTSDTDISSRPDQGVRRSPTAAATAAAAAAATANAAALQRSSVDLEAGRTPQAAAGSPLAGVVSSPPAQQQQQRWRLPNLPWSSSAAAKDDDTAAAGTAAAAADTANVEGAAGTRKADAAVSGVTDDFEAPSCAVCLCEYASGELVRQLPCNHEFHQSCIDQWMVSHGTCPICRAPLWAGALEDEQAADGASDDRSDNPAAIYVHHELADGRGGVGVPAAAGGAAGEGAIGDREWVRRLRQWRERNRLQHQQQRQQQQAGTEEPPAAAAAAIGAAPAVTVAGWQELAMVREQQQQQQQQQEEALAVTGSPQQQQQQQQQPQLLPHLRDQQQQQQQQVSTASPAGADAADAGGGGSDQFMGAFTLGRRRRQQQ